MPHLRLTRVPSDKWIHDFPCVFESSLWRMVMHCNYAGIVRYFVCNLWRSKVYCTDAAWRSHGTHAMLCSCRTVNAKFLLLSNQWCPRCCQAEALRKTYATFFEHCVHCGWIFRGFETIVNSAVVVKLSPDDCTISVQS